MTVEENLAGGEVRYVDRRDGGLKTEAIYGERALRWVYGNPLGRLAQCPVLSIINRGATSGFATFGGRQST